jgi:hypothetical protein
MPLFCRLNHRAGRHFGPATGRLPAQRRARVVESNRRAATLYAVQALEDRTLLASIALFYNASYVNTNAGGPAASLMQELTTQGNTVTTFTGIDTGSVTAAVASAQILVFPAFSNGDLNAAMTSPAKQILTSYAANGGGIISCGDPSNHNMNFLISTFGLPLTNPTPTFFNPTTSTLTSYASGTSFASGPSSIPPNTATAGFVDSSANFLPIYNYDSNAGSVVAVFRITGSVSYNVADLGWDWTSGGPSGTQNGGWNTVLSETVQQVAKPVTLGSLKFLQQPVNTAPGVVLNPPVRVEVDDLSGNRLINNSSQVTIGMTSGPAGDVINGTTTVTASSGIALFNTISFTPAGTYVLFAAALQFNSVTSTSFTIGATTGMLAFAQQPTTTAPGQAISPSVTVDVENLSGQLLTGDNSLVTLSVASGPNGGTLGGTVSANAVNGVATFNNLTLSAAGNYSVLASDGSFASATSTGFTVTNSTANLAFVTQPSGALVNSAITPPVEVAIDSGIDGHLLTGDASAVTLAIASGTPGAILGGTVTVNAVGGIATFSNLAINAVGTYALVATDGQYTAATSNPLVIGTTLLSIAQQPAHGLAQSTLNPPFTVDILDAGGQPIPGDSAPVTLAIASGPSGATLGGTTTEMAANGVATFPDLTLSQAGVYTLVATSGTSVPATSTGVQIGNPSNLPMATVVILSNHSTADFGQAVTLTATVTGPGGVPTGNVQFYGDGMSLGTAMLSNAIATLTVSTLPAGTLGIYAAYLGDSSFQPTNSGAIAQIVKPPIPTGAQFSAALGGNPITLVPGNTARTTVTVTNSGVTGHGVLGIALFASIDGTFDDGTIVAVRPAAVSVSLRSGGVRSVPVTFTVPNSLQPGNYILLAQLTAGKGLTADQVLQPTAPATAPQATVTWSFGTVAGHRGTRLVLTQPDGTLVTYSLAGPGTGTVVSNGSANPSLVFTGTSGGSTVTLATRGGSNSLTLAGLTADAPIGAISAPTVSFDGNFNVNGSLGRLVLESLSDSNLAASSFTSVQIRGGVDASKILAGTYFGADNAPGGGDDSFAAGSIRSLTVAGSVTGSLIAAGLDPADGIYLNGNDTLVGGAIVTASIGGVLSSDSHILASALPRTTRINHVAVVLAGDPRFEL